ncbi:MAG: ABC transporter ATP-binding protein [Christensenellales bacterium]|jgi:ATP-binding cassette subfamily B multidrug efflux pump
MSEARKAPVRRRGPMGGGPHGHGAGEKPKNFGRTAKRLLGYLKPYLWQMIVVFIMAASATVFSILSPRIMGRATTSLFASITARLGGDASAAVDFGFIGYILGVMIALYVLSSAFSYFQQFLMAGVSQRLVRDLRSSIDQKLGRMPLAYFDRNTTGDILSRITNDVDNISGTLQQSLTQLMTSAVTLIGVVVMMLLISPLLTLICLVTLPLCLIITLVVASRSQKYFRKQWAYTGDINGHIEEMYTGHKVIKVFGREQASLDRFNEINEQLYTVGWKGQFISGVIFPLMGLVNNLSYVFICVVGGIRVTSGSMTIGDVQAFIQYARQFTQPINQTSQIVNTLQSTMASAERVFELLDEPEEVPEAEHPVRLTDCQGHVTLEHVDFSYVPDKPLITDMNLDVAPGQTVAIVGPTGAGKTTIVNLLMRFYETNSGTIRVDGVDIRDMTRNNLRDIFGMVLQDTWLFEGTVYDNIAYGSATGATREQVVAAAKAARVHHFIMTLPQGYDTVLTEDASNISQGQKQLLTIARAFLSNPMMLILDEATSSVDTRTEVLIQKAMNALKKGRTSFVIAHRLSTIRDADIILVMKGGSIVEQGTHEQLLAQKGFYAELYNSQFTQGDQEETA